MKLTVSHSSPLPLFLSYGTIENQTLLDHDHLFVNPYLEGDPDEIISEEDLPFTRFKLPPEEEEVGSIRTSTYVHQLIISSSIDIKFTFLNTRIAQAWVVDIPDQCHIATMLKCVTCPFPFLSCFLHSFVSNQIEDG